MIYSASKKRNDTHIEKDIGPHQAKIAPSLRVEDVEIIGEEFVRCRGGAVATSVGSTGIGDVAAGGVDVRGQVIPTCLARWWGEVHQLFVLADNRVLAHS